MILIEEDHPTKIHTAFFRYFIGAGFHMDQDVVVYDSVGISDWNNLVPTKLSSSAASALEKKEAQRGSDEVVYEN